MKANKKNIIWAIILTSVLIIFLATGCKPKQIIQERTITKVDSSAVISLKSDLQKKTTEVEMLKSDLERTRDENSRLQEEVSKHEVEYDTSGPVNPQTGKPPVKKETTTVSKSMLERTVKDYEIKIAEYKKEAAALTIRNKNLEYEVNQLRDENRELKEKIVPTTGFNFRLFFYGVAAGIIAVIAILLFIKK